MEIVEGATLEARLAHGPLAVEETRQVGIQIADALDAAHDRGIVHRDLKPSNVVIGPMAASKCSTSGGQDAPRDEPGSRGPVNSPDRHGSTGDIRWRHPWHCAGHES